MTFVYRSVKLAENPVSVSLLEKKISLVLRAVEKLLNSFGDFAVPNPLNNGLRQRAKILRLTLFSPLYKPARVRASRNVYKFTSAMRNVAVPIAYIHTPIFKQLLSCSHTNVVLRQISAVFTEFGIFNVENLLWHLEGISKPDHCFSVISLNLAY
jgi:hypothetical protein